MYTTVRFQLINHLFNILDTMMASHVSAIAVSAVAYLSQLQNMISAVGTGLAVGSSLKSVRHMVPVIMTWLKNG